MILQKRWHLHLILYLIEYAYNNIHMRIYINILYIQICSHLYKFYTKLKDQSQFYNHWVSTGPVSSLDRQWIQNRRASSSIAGLTVWVSELLPGTWHSIPTYKQVIGCMGLVNSVPSHEINMPRHTWLLPESSRVESKCNTNYSAEMWGFHHSSWWDGLQILESLYPLSSTGHRAVCSETWLHEFTCFIGACFHDGHWDVHSSAETPLSLSSFAITNPLPGSWLCHSSSTMVGIKRC